MSRARKKESCTCIYRCFTSKTPGCIPCLSLGSACPTPLKRLNWRLSFKFPSYTSELRGTLFQNHNTLTQLKLEPRPLDLEFEWSPQKPQGHIISQLPSPLHKETVGLGTTGKIFGRLSHWKDSFYKINVTITKLIITVLSSPRH